ncbi:MAG: DUF6702 family protein [Myxococcota bacterium]
MIGRRTVLGGVAGLLVARTGWAHPYHVSTAEVRLRGGKLEVTLEVSPEDLQEALRRLTGKDIDIDGGDAISPLIRAYLQKHFTLRGPNGPIPMVWVGSEIELEAAWLYFEYEIPGSPLHYMLYSGVFFDIAPAQVNRVLVRQGKKTRTLRFRPGDRPQRLG